MIYPEIAKLMACKKMCQKDLGHVIGRTQQAVEKKLNGKTEFKLSEIVAIKEHFKDIDPIITWEKLFEIYLTQ